jgi:hypothetical protein
MVRSSRYARFAIYVQVEWSGYVSVPRETSFRLPRSQAHSRLASGQGIQIQRRSIRSRTARPVLWRTTVEGMRVDGLAWPSLKATPLPFNPATQPGDARTRRVARRHRARR